MGENKKKKIDWKKKKDNTIRSLQEVENFLGRIKNAKHYWNWYRILK